ncbi:hypothetical protein DPMN_186271 [Dreissena polymorpha]|uniref:Uncharacterized protein n=1 Tax=Dreissena polymorpha TaxID=45954 RepID=A0A9D4DPD4_DREPO|nr:hypothetical protein DPMN_186271 [Dreissena polymorpha]
MSYHEYGSAVDRNKKNIRRNDGNYMVDNCIQHDEAEFCSACFKSFSIIFIV